ncbi:hypothetical protein [Chryseobacterium sp. G0201]|uniref:hypothetical protein n=1 Tax=Chryseobacterium sp. G0201 TaxID=2487065 RepID=UPI000F515698|nr:hypothetical protein [Chryseobacterium sp. G0201]AZA52813.1 hypothetical protein EG348_07240 [Chryseobacterium sp. G0201]
MISKFLKNIFSNDKIENKNLIDNKISRKFHNLKNNSFNDLKNLGFNEAILIAKFNKEKIKDNEIEKLKDFIWSAYNHLIAQNSNNNQTLSMIYYFMSTFSLKNKDSINSIHLRELSSKHKLLSLKVDGIEGEVIIIGGKNCCQECNSDNGKIFDYNFLVKTPRLPHKNCSNKYGCRCTYGFQAKRDKNGSLIFRNSAEIEKLLRENGLI